MNTRITVKPHVELMWDHKIVVSYRCISLHPMQGRTVANYFPDRGLLEVSNAAYRLEEITVWNDFYPENYSDFLAAMDTWKVDVDSDLNPMLFNAGSRKHFIEQRRQSAKELLGMLHNLACELFPIDSITSYIQLKNLDSLQGISEYHKNKLAAPYKKDKQDSLIKNSDSRVIEYIHFVKGELEFRPNFSASEFIVPMETVADYWEAVKRIKTKFLLA